MGEIERIRRYIEQTRMARSDEDHYDMCCSELEALCRIPDGTPAAVVLAFNYGRAKGYRAGKKAATSKKGECDG